MPNGDSVIIRWEGPAGAAGNTLSLMTCFSNSSAVDRPWRKANAVISVRVLRAVYARYGCSIAPGAGCNVPAADRPWRKANAVISVRFAPDMLCVLLVLLCLLATRPQPPLVRARPVAPGRRGGCC